MRVFFLLAMTSFSFSTLLKAQSDQVQFVWEGGGLVNYKLNDLWSGNTGIGKRSIWSTPESGALSGRLAFLEADQFLTRKMNPFLKASAGYKFRWVNPTGHPGRYEHRLTQQLAWTHLEKRIRMVSRFRTEQRFRTLSFAHRYRYSFSADLPLAGERLDVKEFYLALANELLFEAVDVEENTLEDRISASLGYLISDQMKAEFNITLRLEDITRTVEEITFFNTRVFYTLN